MLLLPLLSSNDPIIWPSAPMIGDGTGRVFLRKHLLSEKSIFRYDIGKIMIRDSARQSLIVSSREDQLCYVRIIEKAC